MKIAITTHPFNEVDVLESAGHDVKCNPFGRRIKPDEVLPFVRDADAIIAGTETYTREMLEQCKAETISRVGVGYDNIDLQACRDLGIFVTYTPDAPRDGVAELTVAQIIALLRGIGKSGASIRRGEWKREMGQLISEVNIGILGVGRIGSRVAKLLKPFGGVTLGCDIDEKVLNDNQMWLNASSMDNRWLFEDCDIVTVHVPMNEQNRHLVNYPEINAMPRGSYLINNSRGAIVNESVVMNRLQTGQLAGYAADTFEEEPYTGPLAGRDDTLLTAHIGSSTKRCRYLMEKGAADNCIIALKGQKVPEKNIVPFERKE